MSDRIQQARDILNKWKTNAAPGEWYLGDRDPVPGWESLRAVDVTPDGAITDYIDENDARFIVGMINLWDSIDSILDHAAWNKQGFGDGIVSPSAQKIADAIIAIEERMNNELQNSKSTRHP